MKTPFVIKPLEIKLKGLEEVLERSESTPGISKNFVDKKFKRYEGSFLIFGNNLIRIPKLDFLDYKKLEFDVNDFGVFPAVVHNNFYQGKLHGHFDDGSILDFQRKNYVGKVDTKRYFKQQLFDDIFDKYKNNAKWT